MLGIGLSVPQIAEGAIPFKPVSLFVDNVQGALYDVSDLSTLFQDTAGTSPVTATGQSVARINDKSGKGNNAVQSTSGSRPTYQVDANGKPYLAFDGVDDVLISSTTLTQLVAPWEFWAGINITTNGGLFQNLFCLTSTNNATAGSNNTEGLFQRSDGTNRSIICASRVGTGTSYSVTLTSAFTVNTAFVARASGEVSTDQLRVTVGANSSTASATYTGTPSSSASFRIGTGVASCVFRFYGGLAIDRALTAPEATALSNWFKTATGT